MAASLARSVGHENSASAGTIALSGSPATPEAVAVMAEIGIDLTEHTATDVWALDLADAAVFALAAGHVAELERRRPGASVQLLDPQGRSIPDPYGMEIDAYRHVRDLIVAAVTARFDKSR